MQRATWSSAAIPEVVVAETSARPSLLPTTGAGASASARPPLLPCNAGASAWATIWNAAARARAWTSWRWTVPLSVLHGNHSAGGVRTAGSGRRQTRRQTCVKTSNVGARGPKERGLLVGAWKAHRMRRLLLLVLQARDCQDRLRLQLVLLARSGRSRWPRQGLLLRLRRIPGGRRLDLTPSTAQHERSGPREHRGRRTGHRRRRRNRLRILTASAALLAVCRTQLGTTPRAGRAMG